MTDLRSWLAVALAALLAATFVAGCTSTGTSGGGGYSSKGSRGGGWENFRAEAPVVKPLPDA